MAYIFDPIRNTFIDDEDKSLGNKLALNDEEIDKVIKQIDDKFGPGTVVPASELPPKEDPYKDFMDRNPMADASNDEGYLDSRLDEMLKAYQDYLSSAGGSKKVIPLNVFASTYAKENFKDGGMIGGGVIQGEYGATNTTTAMNYLTQFTYQTCKLRTTRSKQKRFGSTDRK